MVKNLPANAGDCKGQGFYPWVEKIPWRRKWQPTAGILPGRFHRQKSLVGYGPWGLKESDTSERLNQILNYFLNLARQTSKWGGGDTFF